MQDNSYALLMKMGFTPPPPLSPPSDSCSYDTRVNHGGSSTHVPSEVDEDNNIAWDDLAQLLFEETMINRQQQAPIDGRGSASTSGCSNNTAHILKTILKDRTLVLDSDDGSLPNGCPSIGSILHDWGLCKPCVFAHKLSQSCRNGPSCVFCHRVHPGTRRRNAITSTTNPTDTTTPTSTINVAVRNQHRRQHIARSGSLAQSSSKIMSMRNNSKFFETTSSSRLSSVSNRREQGEPDWQASGGKDVAAKLLSAHKDEVEDTSNDVTMILHQLQAALDDILVMIASSD